MGELGGFDIDMGEYGGASRLRCGRGVLSCVVKMVASGSKSKMEVISAGLRLEDYY